MGKVSEGLFCSLCTLANALFESLCLSGRKKETGKKRGERERELQNSHSQEEGWGWLCLHRQKISAKISWLFI